MHQRKPLEPMDRPCDTDDAGHALQLDRLQGFVLRGRMYDFDVISRLNQAVLKNNAHDACLANDRAVFGTAQHRCEQTRLKILDLRAWIAEPCDLDNGVGANSELRTGCQRKQINSTGGDVLPQLPGLDAKSGSRDISKEFFAEEMDLPKVGLGRISGYP